jgi:hypothetical protein
MARGNIKVTLKPAEAGRVPECAVAGIALVEVLARRGVLEKVEGSLKIRRKGGYCGFDVALVLLLYFASSASVGLNAGATRRSPRWQGAGVWRRPPRSLGL